MYPTIILFLFILITCHILYFQLLLSFSQKHSDCTTHIQGGICQSRAVDFLCEIFNGKSHAITNTPTQICHTHNNGDDVAAATDD